MANTDYSSAFATGGNPGTSSAVSTTSSPYAGAFAAEGSISSDQESPLTGPAQEPTGPAQHAYQDPNKGWAARAWDFANTPLTESLLGWNETRPGAGGFERGIEHIASSLTSPLSLALEAATFGSGSLIEGAGAAALRESEEFSAEEIPQILKASQASLQAAKDLKPLEPVINQAVEAGGHDLSLLNRAREAVSARYGDAQLASEEAQNGLSKIGLSPEQMQAWQDGDMTAAERQELATAHGGFSDKELEELAKTGKSIAEAVGTKYKPISEAVEATGLKYSRYLQAQQVLKNNGLDEANDLLGGNALVRGAFQILRKALPSVPIAESANIAKGANTLLNAGFTLQQFQTAAQMSPMFLDAIKEGDYDKAWEYGTEAAAGTLLGVLGAPHALHSAGELFNPILESDKLRPSDEWAAVQRANQDREATHSVAERHAINIFETALKKAGLEVNPGPLGWSDAQKAVRQGVSDRIAISLHTGGDLDKAQTLRDVLRRATGEEPEGGAPVAPARPLIGPNPDVQNLAKSYVDSQGINKPQHEGLVPVGSEFGKQVADAYEEMEHNPNDPKVKASYDALIKETKAQWDAAKAAGYTFEPWPEEGQPYANSAEMAEDVKNNKHLYYFQGGDIPEDHPLAGVDPETGETYNNIFRAVHDLFGHAKNGYEFGPRGEENAFIAHSRMYSNEAVPALMSETKGQNSWVNFGPHLRDENGNIPAKGEKGYVAPPARPFAEQKAGLLPPEMVANYQYRNELPGGIPLSPKDIPSRTVTKVLSSNEAGEVRVGTDGRPVVWLSPEAWGSFEKEAGTGRISGFSYSPEEADDIARKLDSNNPVQKLFAAARDASKEGQLTGSRVGTGVDVVAEELHHTWQRELAQNAEIASHLAPEQWRRLYDIIPRGTQSALDEFGYRRDPVARVAETAAKFMSGLHEEFGASEAEKNSFLKEYYKEVKAQHGENALKAAQGIAETARQHIEEIYADREKAARVLAQPKPSEEGIRGAGEGQRSGPEQGDRTESEGSSSGDGQKGLASKETEEGLSNRPDIRRVFHWTRKPEDFDETDPALEGTGVRGSGTSRPFVPGTYFGEHGYREPMVQGNAKKYYADIDYNRVYDTESDPLGLIEKAQTASKKSGKGPAYEYEKLIQDNGYEGYRNHGVVKYFKPVKVTRDLGGFGLMSRRVPAKWDDIKEYLTDEELAKHDTPEKQNLLVAAFNALPDREEWTAALRAGRAGQMWYERSSRAFDALLDSGADSIKPADKEKFLNFVAALSPVQPVRQNLLMALNLWNKWDKAGRPTDVEWKGSTPASKNASLYRILKGRGNSSGVDLLARLNNAIRALQGEPMSGPKVSSFAKNLGEDANRVTHDTWMAVIGGKDPNRINKPAIYDAMSARVREAAKEAGVPPRQAQAAIWSFIKSLAELSGWGNDRWIPPQEIIKQGLLTPELVAKHSADFADLLQHDPEIRGLIQKLGGNLDEFDKKLESYVPGRPVSGENEGASSELLNAAGRLEAARKDSRIAAHLARKSGPSLFDNTEFSPVNGLFSREKENVAPVWYLKSNQLIDSRMQGPMPADTVLKMLENNGVKPDELKYTGFQEFLKDKGKAPVRPDELRDYLAANNLQVREVTKGAPYSPNPEVSRLREEYDSLTNEIQANLQDRLGLGDGEVDNLINGLDSAVARGRSEDEAVSNFPPSSQNQARELFRTSTRLNAMSVSEPDDSILGRKSPTKFGSYTLPGGQNYREMLLTLPEKQGEFRSRREMGDALSSKYGPNYLDKMTPEEERQYYSLRGSWQADRGLPAQGTFLSSHWDEPNVVGHVRFNDRTGPNGEKLLHLEELQSDWHQKGRTQGYNGGRVAGNFSTRLSYDEHGRPTYQIVDDTGQAWAEGMGGREQAQTALDRFNQRGPFKTGAVPDAPFKKTWPELLFKRMIRYAAENGYDGISWTPGEEQAARYDLSKQISKIEATKTFSGRYALVAKDHTGRAVLDDVYTPEQLPDVVGKELSQKIINEVEAKPVEGRTHNKVYSGLDLKVGGEGMKGFYDKIFPETVNKLGKQFGAKVGETKIDSTPALGHENFIYEGPNRTNAEVREYVLDQSHTASLQRQAREVYALMSDGMSFAEAMQKEGSPALAYDFGGKINIEKPTITKSVPYFPITDSLRESVLKQGQPLFARERPLNGLPENIEDLIRTNVFKDMPKEYRDRIFGALDDLIENRLTPEVKEATRYLRDEDNKNYQIGATYNLIHHFVQDHMTRMYEDDNPAGKVVASQAKAGKFATNVSQAKRQVYETFATALLKSPKKIKFDPANIISGQRAELIKAAANRKLIDTLRDKFTRASDGRPAVVLGGSGRVVAGENGEDPTTLVSPERIRMLQIAPNAIEAMRKSGDLQRFLEDGTIKDLTPKVRPDNIKTAIARLEEQGISKEAQYDEEGNNILRKNLQLLKDVQEGRRPYSDLKEYNDQLKPVLAWDPQDYISMNHGSFKDWNFVTNDTSGNKILVKSDIRVHPEFAEYMKNRLGLEPSAVSGNPVGRALLGAASATKHVLLSLSPFHMVQEGLRAIMLGVNPFGIAAPDILTGERVDPSDPNSPTIIKKAVEHGLTTGTDYKSLQQHSEGLATGGNVLRLIPGVGKTIANSLDWYQDYLFKRYIPALKARSTELLFNQYRDAHPEWSTDRIAKVTAEHANRTFGGINWQAMGRSATTQDWGRLLLLAPDWLESEMRSGAALFNKEEGGLSRTQVARMALGLWGVARVLNYATTGNFHNEAPFGLAVKNKEGKETVFGIRTLPTDLIHAATDPVGFLKGRLSPTVRTGTELITGRDQYGRKLGPQDMWADVFHQMMPIPAQSIGQIVTGTGPEIGNTGQAWKAVGGTAQTYSSPAQKMAAELAANHSEDGPIDPAQMARHRRIIQFEDQARSGQLSWPDLMKMTYQTDQLSESELKQIQNNVKKTQGMDPSMAALYTRASRLPAKEFLDLWDIANPREKTALIPLMKEVQRRYLTKAKKDMTPEDRQRDPTFNRLLNMIPPQPPQAQQ